MASFKELKERVYEANMELPRRGLVMYTFGNASGIDRDRGVFAIKPSGVPYNELTPGHMVIVDLDNRFVDGSYNPSSDTRTHSVLYRHFPDIGGVVHTHSTYATSWAQARQPIPCYGTTHADHTPNAIPVTVPLSREQIEGDYESETGLGIVDLFAAAPYNETPMALVAGHGPFTWGESPEKAVYNSVVLEELAKMALFTRMIDSTASSLDKNLIHRHYDRKHGAKATYGQDMERNEQ